MLKVAYSFTTLWHVDAPQHVVWEEIFHPEQWPHWWKAVRAVESLRPGDAQGIGRCDRVIWKGALPYTLVIETETVRVEPFERIEHRSRGELEGTGLWQFAPHDGQTIVRYDWNVCTTKPWMNRLAPLARPLFEWNHHVVMRQGGVGLNRQLTGGA